MRPSPVHSARAGFREEKPANASSVRNARLLAIVGQRLPAILDANPRRGPVPDPWLPGGPSLAALNPQPLPPIELGLVIATEFLRAAWLADRFGLDMARVQADFERLCPDPPKPPVPPLGWWPPIPDPIPHPNWLVDFYLGLAARIATAADGGPATARFVDDAIDRAVTVMEAARDRPAGNA